MNETDGYTFHRLVEELQELRLFKERVEAGIGEAIVQIPPGPDGERATRLLLDYVPELKEKLATR